MSNLITCLSLQQLILRITHTPTHPHTHIQGEHSKLALAWRDCGKPQNCLSQESWPPGSYSDPWTSQLRHKSDYYLVHLVACTKHFKAVKNKKHSYCVQRTVAKWYHSNTMSCIREKGMFKLFHLLQSLIYNTE
jgi:hypothetical protein